eukprot:CAMPEP_0181392276 /NCGR_PEP_ID=MMETSP1106-20121128/26496_1 /TAXON_ID=81844 /ORGANISM="Mantoniella antarctica, Strain SL-175" /LENGTH=104 /DNA_ID=CAMNT_0023513371 /DNA_START=198 /DNA_END=508 /DNA_ORIENTATION=-
MPPGGMPPGGMHEMGMMHQTGYADTNGHSGPGAQFVGSMNLIGAGQGGPDGLGGVVQRTGQGGPGGMVLMQPPRGPSMGIPMGEPGGGGGGPGHDWGAPRSIRG